MNHQELRFRGIKLKDLGAMQSYLTEHAKKNPDVDLSLSYMNHAIENLSPEQLESRVVDRITQLDLKKRPRFDSIGIEDILVSPSEEFTENVELSIREQYFRDALHFFQSRYGKENVMYCQCHMDESEPHIHVGIVPVTSEGQLSATKLFTYQETKLLAAEFHRAIAEEYTLKCAEHYLNENLEAHRAKVDQLTLKLQIVSKNIGDAEEKQKELDRILNTVKTFVGEDNVEYSELDAYDALTDMAEALNLPPRALSLNGSLGLAFGARGRGGKNAPLAHYEPVKVVINLTKNKGSGSLGHEWFHAVDNYFGRKERETTTAMISHCVNQFEIESVSAEAMEGFKLVSKVIERSGISERCQNLDKRREKQYWSLPEEMMARAFEVYLKSKLEEQGIRNDYLVNYRSEESWTKATENGFKMENTYPYPTATETADIKEAFDYLFDSIRFKVHDENYELYSASTADIRELLKDSRLLFARELNYKQTALQKMSEEVFGVEVKYFEGARELHGRFDDDRNIIYLNGQVETSLDWAFWHEAFHVMKKQEPELYADILAHVECHEIFTSQQIENYRKAVKQPKMSKSRAIEEMLADAFADMKTGRRVFDKISEENQSLADKLAAFTRKLLDGVKKFFHSKEVHEKYPAVTLTSKQFREFATRIDENICSMQGDKALRSSKGYKILRAAPHSPYEYAPKKQKAFDIQSAKELTKKYSSESVQKVIQDLSPLGRKDKNYGREILQEVRAFGR